MWFAEDITDHPVSSINRGRYINVSIVHAFGLYFTTHMASIRQRHGPRSDEFQRPAHPA